MITTLTVNPSIDVTIAVDHLDVGEVHRVQAPLRQAGGKGVNVAAALLTGGLDSQAMVLCGAVQGAGYLGLMADQGVPAVLAETGTTPRTNLSLIEADGRTTKLNEPGETLDASLIDGVLNAVADAAKDSSWVVAAGSLAPGLPADFYARLAERLTGTGCRVALDASGPALAAALQAPGVVLKPNLEELQAVSTQSIQTVDDGVRVAQQIVADGPSAVLLSLGGDGAVLITEDVVLAGVAPCAEVRNTVGAGDSMLAGYVAGHQQSGGDPAESLRSALAWGRAAVRTAGTGLNAVEQEDLEAVTIGAYVSSSGGAQ